VIVTDDTDTYVIFNYLTIELTSGLFAQVATNKILKFATRYCAKNFFYFNSSWKTKASLL